MQHARDQVANALGVQRDEVIFTSGATESNNLAILGLAPFAEREQRRHVITSTLEHKAVLNPSMPSDQGLRDHGASRTTGGYTDPDRLKAALRKDTVLVSIMHVNNETGVEQPLHAICDVLNDHPAYLHVDAAQGFGKHNAPLRDPRIDLVSISAHKIYGPKGVGALVLRRRGNERPPLTPLTFGGGQERGLRPGTLPMPLIVGLGMAAELATKHHVARSEAIRAFREEALQGLAPLGPEYNGDQTLVLPHS